MSGLATEQRVGARSRRRGTALMGTLVVFAGLTGLIYATTIVSGIDLKDSRGSLEALRADQLAESGLERGRHFLFSATQKAGSADPLSGITQLFAAGNQYNAWVAEPLIDGGGKQGAYSVVMTLTPSRPRASPSRSRRAATSRTHPRT